MSDTAVAVRGLKGEDQEVIVGTHDVDEINLIVHRNTVMCGIEFSSEVWGTTLTPCQAREIAAGLVRAADLFDARP